MRNLSRYQWAESPADALRQLAAGPGRGVFLGGGTCLVARQDADLDFVVDLSRAGLDRIETTPTGLRVGATVTLQTLLEESRLAALTAGLLTDAIGRTRTEPWRRQATLAGRLLERDPGDVVEPCLTVLDARLHLQPAADLASEIVPLGQGLARVAQRDAGGLVVAIEIPKPSRGWGFRLETAARSVQDVPLAVVAAGVRIENDRIVEARVATSGLPAPRPAPAAQAAVVRSGDGVDFAPALAALAGDIEPTDDWRASASYRLHLAAVLLGRALRGACDAARRNGG